ncbi:MAG TPA: glycosyltransferase family 39 protein [Chloroflexota bacterium]|nr:glycosyltransferase family 39 protein [Chloroflexota bacterium]HUM67797.1 glycosyltransferase family 39 protein [Chloroflexota bacterium]
MLTYLQNRLIPLLIILLAFFIRLHTLDLQPLWFDESMEFWVATASLDKLFEAVKTSLQDPPLYSLLLHFWMNLGRDEFTLRLLSTFISLLSIATIFTLGRHVHSQSAGVVSAFFLALLPPEIRFAQEVGQYAILIFTLLLNLLVMSYARQTNRGRYWAIWVITALLCIYNYYGSLLIIIAVAGVVFVENVFRRKKKYLVKQIVALLVFILLILPLAIGWIPHQLFQGPTSNAFATNFHSLSIEANILLTNTRQLLAYQLTGYIAEPELWTNLQLLAWVMILISLFFSVLGLAKSTRHAYLLVWLLVSWILYYVAGRMGVYPYGGTRHALILTPLLVLAVSVGITTMWQIWRPLSLAMFIGISVITVVAPREAPEDLRSVATYFLANRTDNIPAYVYYGAVPGFRYQLQSDGDLEEEIPATWYRECWAGALESYCTDNEIIYGRWIRQLSPEEKVSEILATITHSSQTEFWLLFSHTANAEQDEVVNTLKGLYVIVDSIEVQGASAYLFHLRQD